MTLTKIKARKGKPVTIHWIEPSPNGQVEEHTLTCEEPGTPELYDAMNEMRHYVADLCGFGVGYEDNMEVIGVTIVSGGSDEERGVVVTALKALSSCDAPLVINTPLAPLYRHKEALDRVECEALRYANGIRAQLEMEFEKQEQEGEEIPAR